MGFLLLLAVCKRESALIDLILIGVAQTSDSTLRAFKAILVVSTTEFDAATFSLMPMASDSRSGVGKLIVRSQESVLWHGNFLPSQ